MLSLFGGKMNELKNGKIKCIGFDICGTLYNKKKEYNPIIGNLHFVQYFFRYGTYVKLIQSEALEYVVQSLMVEYKQRVNHKGLVPLRIKIGVETAK